MSELGDTPWVDRTWKAIWDRVGARVDDAWLPDRREGRKFRVHEYGQGHYGAVSPTNEPGLVVKLTSDASEAAFIAYVLAHPQPERGMVRYRALYRVDGHTFRGRPLWVLWRSEAYEVGGLNDTRINPPFTENSAFFARVRAVHALQRVARCTGPLRHSIVRAQRNRTTASYRALLDAIWLHFEIGELEHVPRFTRVCVESLLETRSAMENVYTTYLSDGIGAAMLHYLDQGLVLADVHLQNVGRDVPGGPWVITDPGHVVPVKTGIRIPEIEGV